MIHFGGFNCGSVTANFAAAPVQTRQRWCRQCQKAAADGPTHNAIFRTGDVALLGEVGRWSYVAESGNTLTKHSVPPAAPQFSPKARLDRNS